MACNCTLKRELTEAFKTSHKALASKLKPNALSNAVASIAVHRILNTALNNRKESAGIFLGCVRSISNLQLSKVDLVRSITLHPLNLTTTTKAMHRLSVSVFVFHTDLNISEHGKVIF